MSDVALTGQAANDSDDELVRRCLDGDEDAWRTLVRRHSPLVWAAARRAGLCDADASDVFQTVWRIAVQDLSRVRHAERFGRWLARTAHFQSMRVLRGYAIARRALDGVRPPEADGSPGPAEELLALEDRLHVSRALERLGERCRDLLRYLYYESPTPTYADIAGRLGMTVGGVGPTRSRCLGRMKTILGGDLDA